MNHIRILFLLLFAIPGFTAENEALIQFFKKAGARITVNSEGEVTKLMSPGKPQHTVAELQKIGGFSQLEQLALNSPPAGDEDWGFLHQLKNLKQLTIWHGKGFSSLAPFCDLPIERLTVGGCMGIRDLNKDSPEKMRDVVFSLRNLPNLTFLNLYHSPHVPQDAHLVHIVEQFPKLEELKIDLGAPRGFETKITPDGFRKLKALPLKVISLETVKSLTPDHMAALAEIPTLEAVLIDARREDIDLKPLVATLEKASKKLEVVASPKGGELPRRKRK